MASFSRKARPEQAESYSIHPEIFFREVEGNVLFLLPGDRKIHFYLSGPATFVWSQLVKRKKIAQIGKLLAKRYRISEARALRDVRALVEQLEMERIINPVRRT